MIIQQSNKKPDDWNVAILAGHAVVEKTDTYSVTVVVSGTDIAGDQTRFRLTISKNELALMVRS